MAHFLHQDLRLLAQVIGGLACSQGQPLLGRADLAQALLSLFRADFLGTTRWNPQARRFEDPLCFNRDSRMSDQYREHYQFVDPISPKLRRRRRASSIYQVVSRTQLLRSEYYADFLLANDVADGVDLYLYDGARILGDLRVWRSPRAPALGEREIELLQVLRPYLLNHFRLREALAIGEDARMTALVTHGGDAVQLSPALQAALGGLDSHAESLLLDRLKKLSQAPQAATTLLGRRVAVQTMAGAGRQRPACSVHLIDEPVQQQAADAAGQPTPRQSAVLGLLVQGLSDKQIARHLDISYWTVRTHVACLMRKAQVRRRGELAFAAIQGPGAPFGVVAE